MKSHIGESISDFVTEIKLEVFGKRIRELKLHTIYSGAANMMKTPQLLRSTNAQHCLAHVIRLILTIDGFSKYTHVKHRLEKCCNEVTSLNFRSAALTNEAVKSNDAEIYQQNRSIAELKEVQDLEDQFPI